MTYKNQRFIEIILFLRPIDSDVFWFFCVNVLKKFKLVFIFNIFFYFFQLLLSFTGVKAGQGAGNGR